MPDFFYRYFCMFNTLAPPQPKTEQSTHNASMPNRAGSPAKLIKQATQATSQQAINSELATQSALSIAKQRAM
jgi:hypothetical protein